MKYAWKELQFYKKKYILIELLLVLMMFMVVFLTGLTNGLGEAVSAAINKSSANTYIISNSAEGVITFSNLSANEQKKVADLDLGKTTPLNIQRTGITRQGHRQKIDVTYFAVVPDDFMTPKISQGKALSNHPNEVVLNDSLKAQGIKLGDKIVDKTSDKVLTVIGFTHHYMYGHSPVAYISQKTYTAINKTVNPQYTFSPQAIVSKQEKPTNSQDLANMDIMSRAEIVEHIPGYSAEQSTLQMILWVLVLASAAILGVFFYIITLQKRREFSVMKAIGMKMSEISRFQLGQVLILATIGIIVGDGLALLLSLVLPASMPFTINWQNIVMVSLAFLAIALLSSILSVIKVAKIDPIEVINGGDEH